VAGVILTAGRGAVKCRGDVPRQFPPAGDNWGMSTPQPWDQQPGEPAEAYARFLIYRGLSVGRSMRMAYAAYLATFPNAVTRVTNGVKRCRAPGHWATDSARWRWVDRANAWDVHHLADTGREAVERFVGLLLVAGKKAAEALARPRCRPKTWKEALDAVDVLAKFVTPEVVNAAAPNKAGGVHRTHQPNGQA
jgi:hypothetical protein